MCLNIYKCAHSHWWKRVLSLQGGNTWSAENDVLTVQLLLLSHGYRAVRRVRSRLSSPGSISYNPSEVYCSGQYIKALRSTWSGPPSNSYKPMNDTRREEQAGVSVYFDAMKCPYLDRNSKKIKSWKKGVSSFVSKFIHDQSQAFFLIISQLFQYFFLFNLNGLTPHHHLSLNSKYSPISVLLHEIRLITFVLNQNKTFGFAVENNKQNFCPFLWRVTDQTSKWIIIQWTQRCHLKCYFPPPK